VVAGGPPAGEQSAPSSDSLDAAVAEARDALDRGDLEGAVAAWRRAQGVLGLELLYGDDDRFRYVESAEIQRGLARAYLALDLPYAAAVEAARGANMIEDDAGLWTVLGIARYRLADMDGATEALEKALALDPRLVEAEWGLALVAASENRLEEARLRGARALSLAPEPRFALGLAQWSAAAGEFAAAAAALATFLQLAPDDPRSAGYESLRGFYAEVASAPANRIDPRVTRAQLGFDLKSGDEIPYVPVRFNGGAEAYVLFDTGAERNVIDREFARSIGVERIWPGGALHGAYRQSPGGYALVDSLGLGSVSIERVPFAVGDFETLHLRGQGPYYIAAVINPALVLRDFVVVLDYGHRRIELVRYDAGGSDYLARSYKLRRTVVPFRFDANAVWPVLSVSLDGSRPLPFLADTGVSDVLLGRATGAALRLNPERFSAAAGDHVKDDLRAILLDGTPGEPWGIDIHGVMGYPFFRDMRVVFDYRRMEMALEN
jgi:tetratricopeptide (TPR) repeat protein